MQKSCEQRKSLASEKRSRQNIFEARDAESGSARDYASEPHLLIFNDKNISKKSFRYI